MQNRATCVQVSLRYTRLGTRFFGLGVGGLVATWRQDLPPAAGGLGYADWVHHVSEADWAATECNVSAEMGATLLSAVS